MYISPKEVVQHSATLVPDQLVSISQYHRGALGPPLAVGRMAVSSDTLRSAEETDIKGKAVYVLHTWKDALWEMGPSKKTDPPPPREVQAQPAENTEHQDPGESGPGSAAAEATEDAADGETGTPPTTEQSVKETAAEAAAPGQPTEEQNTAQGLTAEGLRRIQRCDQ